MTRGGLILCPLEEGSGDEEGREEGRVEDEEGRVEEEDGRAVGGRFEAVCRTEEEGRTVRA